MLRHCSQPAMQQMLAELPAAHRQGTDQGLPERHHLKNLSSVLGDCRSQEGAGHHNGVRIHQHAPPQGVHLAG